MQSAPEDPPHCQPAGYVPIHYFSHSRRCTDRKRVVTRALTALEEEAKFKQAVTFRSSGGWAGRLDADFKVLVPCSLAP